jgi:hypothetical protein
MQPHNSTGAWFVLKYFILAKLEVGVGSQDYLKVFSKFCGFSAF